MPKLHMAVPEDFMEFAYVLDENMRAKMILDSYTSFVWTERFYDAGEFIMTLPVDMNIVQMLNISDYISIRESDRLMVLETMTLTTDEDGFDALELTGRSIESVLERRIIWGSFKEAGKIETVFEKLLNTQVISPSEEKRKIPGIVFEKSGDASLDTVEIAIPRKDENGKLEKTDAIGDNVFELIKTNCDEKHVGFKMVLKDDNTVAFVLTPGANRTRSQNVNDPVIFSHSYENLLSSEFIQSEVGYASNALMATGSEGVYREVIRLEERTGLRRREIFVSEASANNEIMLKKAKSVFNEHNVTIEFSGEIDFYHQFEYGRDYFLGDIVEIENRYGFGGAARLTEMVFTRDAEGPVITPTFSTAKEEEYQIKEGSTESQK